MKFINVLFFLLIMLSVFAAFKPQAIEFSSEVYYYVMEKKEEPDYQDQDYKDILKSEKYWDDGNFLIDLFAEDLGYVPAVQQFEPKLMNGEATKMWRRGRRFFAISPQKTVIGIRDDEWDDLYTCNSFAKKDGFAVVSGGSAILENVDEETMVYIISEMEQLSQSDSLRVATEKINRDIEDYHTNGVSK